MTKQPEYSDAFIRNCELLFQDIRENQPLKLCIDRWHNTRGDHQHPLESLWFIYYMFFAIHNPKLEEYINIKHVATATHASSAANILKNMIRRRAYTSTLVFQLYRYANINKRAVTYIYPSAPIIKSLTTSHLKTAAVVIHKIHTGAHAQAHTATIESLYSDYVDTIETRAPPASETKSRLSHIKYARKDIILLSLVCYMKIEESDINAKGIFISATNDEITALVATPSTSTLTSTPRPYDEKYKYLLT
jgi:hypothetical protein